MITRYHVDEKVVDDVILLMESEFGKMDVKKGDIHNFLGIGIEYLRDGRAKMEMTTNLKKAVEIFGEELTPVTTPAKNDLMGRDEKSPKVSEERRNIFHSVVMLILYVALRTRRDLHPTSAVLSARVNDTTEEDYKKLRRMIRYIVGTIDEVCYVGADNLNTMITYIDASYAVYPDFKSHTGGVTSFGIGVIASTSSKQKINTKSSTEAELVGIADRIPKVMHHKLFMEAQGHQISRNIIQQDNKSTILMANNGRLSCSKRSRHLNIRYFYVKDLVDQGEVEIQYCPTAQMLADFFTKPLQGSLF